MDKKPSKELAYYLTLFKLEGHKTWRIHLGGDKENFDTEQKNWGENKPVITEKHVLRFDRIRGSFAQL